MDLKRRLSNLEKSIENNNGDLYSRYRRWLFESDAGLEYLKAENAAAKVWVERLQRPEDKAAQLVEAENKKRAETLLPPEFCDIEKKMNEALSVQEQLELARKAILRLSQEG